MTPQIHIGRWVGQGWDMVTKSGNFWNYVLLAFLFFVAMMIAGITGVGSWILYGPLQGVIYFLILEHMRTGRLDVSRYQEGFQQFVQLMVAGLLITLFNSIAVTIFVMPLAIILPIFLPVFLHRGEPSPALWIFLPIMIICFLLAIIASLVIMTLYLFPLLLIIDRKMPFWEAMEESRKTVQKNFWGFFWFTLAMQGINFLGVMLCYIGIFVTMPITYCAIAAAYRDLWPAPVVQTSPEPIT